MDCYESLYNHLIAYTCRKFYSRPVICELADDIVQQVFVEVLSCKDPYKLNFGYMSKACIHAGYRIFRRLDADKVMLSDYDEAISFLDGEEVVNEIISAEDTAEILSSLDVLKEIERVIILQHYFGDFSFAQIAKENGIKLNTVLSHHRRALEKLRSRLSIFSHERCKRADLRGQIKPKHFKSLL